MLSLEARKKRRNLQRELLYGKSLTRTLHPMSISTQEWRKMQSLGQAIPKVLVLKFLMGLSEEWWMQSLGVTMRVNGTAR